MAIAAIAVPVVLHLWNVRHGKTLQVGSILLVQESATRQARSLRLTDVFLFVLRCLLLIVLAILLAKPAWKTQLTTSNEKGWVMMERQGIKKTYAAFQPAIDSLLSAGYRFHYFDSGFAAGKPEDAVKIPVESSGEKERPYWTLLKGLNEQVPADLPVYLFTANRLQRFAGRRPELAMTLKWSTCVSGDTVSNELLKANKTITDSIQILAETGKPTAGYYQAKTIPLSGNGQYSLHTANGKTILRSEGREVEVDTSVLTIAIYTDRFATDAACVKAAIDAIRQYTKRAMKASLISNVDDIKPGTDWLFWLSEAEPPRQLPAHVFRYQKGKEQLTNSWITPAASYAVDGEPVRLSRFIEDTAGGSFETIWRDGYGHAVLWSEEGNHIYHFFSRFNPEWNDLPWSSQFPEMIYQLLTDKGAIKNTDLRKIDTGQLQPVIVKSGKAFDKDKFVETTDVSKIFWLAGFLLFSAERIITLTRKSTEHA